MLTLATETQTTQNLTAYNVVATYTNSTAERQLVWVSYRISGMNGAAANVTHRIRGLASDGTTLIYDATGTATAKPTTTQTVFGRECIGPFVVEAGEKLQLELLSSNGSDTSTSVTTIFVNPLALHGPMETLASMPAASETPLANQLLHFLFKLLSFRSRSTGGTETLYKADSATPFATRTVNADRGSRTSDISKYI